MLPRSAQLVLATSDWQGTAKLARLRYMCAGCGAIVASDQGYSAVSGSTKNVDARIYICPNCRFPTLEVGHDLFPQPRPGEDIPNLPGDLDALYQEARACLQAGAHTAAVMVFRKMLMNIAVGLGAEEGKHFSTYVDYLDELGYVPPGGKEWVDLIRRRGNDANHEIVLMKEKDGRLLLDFVSMLLRIIYDFPARARTQEPQD